MMLWDWFWDLRQSQPPGFSGATPVSNLELMAWVQLTGNRLRREDVGVLKAMDARYCAEIDKESEAIRARETAGSG
jgi:hypothetical protein